MNELLNVSSSPHVRAKDTTSRIMIYVLIALMPASIFGIYNFGLRALMHIVITVAVCVATEYIYERAMKKPITIGDYSAAVTGLLLAMNLPASAPWWLGVIGGIFAILVVKQLFGGLGQNFMNPALAARCFLLISFAGRMTNFVYEAASKAPAVANAVSGASADALSSATPLAALKFGGSVDLMSMFLGTTGGTIGETSALAILIGATFLLVKGVIDLRIPGTYLGSFAIFILIFGGHGLDLHYLAAHLCGGGLMLGAFFMATDYVTTPITKAGQIVYGCALGIVTGIFRVYGHGEGVSYAIIFCNLLVPLIERVTWPKSFGKEANK